MNSSLKPLPLAPQEHHILFISDHIFNFHLIAEYLASQRSLEGLVFNSVSIVPGGLNPSVEKAMREAGYRITGNSLASLKEVKLHRFDLIITIGNSVQMRDVQIPVVLPHIHWELPESIQRGNGYTEHELIQKGTEFIEYKLNSLFDSELLHGLFVVRTNLKLILDNLLDGVMAHTKNRRIFFFNKAAEKMTGYKREHLLGRDCHDVFPGRFCGGDCDFCDGDDVKQQRMIIEKKIQFNRPDNKEKTLIMSTMPLSDENGNNIGALLSFKDETELEMLKSRVKFHHSLGRMVGKDPKMLDVFEQVRQLSSVQAPVLIGGESGTGKELVANAIHDLSARSKKPFVAVNCGALPEGILESELFGHHKGAFTGAVANKKGRFELAHNGTIFLDEIGELSLAMQVKLLRVLQEQRFEPLGSEKTISVNVRVISATNQDLKKMMKQKLFRRDLYYRLCVVPINIPPLRERRLDIPVLVDHFLEQVAQEIERPLLTPSNEVLDIFSRYSWPGNVRELQNAIEYTYVKCHNSIIKPDHLPPELIKSSQKQGKKPGPPLRHSKKEIMIALEEMKGSRKDTAKYLGIGRATLYRYLDIYGLK